MGYVKGALLGTLILFIGHVANAKTPPNVWSASTANGWSEFNITSDTGTTITLLCNNNVPEESDIDPGHDIKVTLPNGKVNTIRENPGIISFLVGGKSHNPPNSLGLVIVNVYWEETIESLTSGESFDVYIKTKKMSTINPSARNVETIFGNKNICVVK